MASRESREFLRDVAEMKRKLRKDIEARALKLDPKAIPERRRRVLRDGDFRFFAYTYFPHHIWGEPSVFQAAFCERFPKLLLHRGGCREWWIAPRGEAKSTLLTKIGPVFIATLALLREEKIRAEVGWKGDLPPNLDYILFLGAELSLPTKLVEVAKVELTTNPVLAMDFPEVCGRSSVWRIGEIVTRSGVRLEPRGADQAVRGTFHGASRPKVLLGDDLITDKEAKSPTERKNRWAWFNQSIDYLGPPDGSVKYLGVGTKLHPEDPISMAAKTIGHLVHHYKALMALPERMDLWQQCEEIMRNQDTAAERAASERGDILSKEDLPSYRFYRRHQRPMDKGAVTSWPGVRSIYDLMKARCRNERAFKTELQGEDLSDEDRIFTHWSFWSFVKKNWVYYAACDPSVGKGKKSDPSGIMVGAWDEDDKILNVVEAVRKRRALSVLYGDLIKVQLEYRCKAIGFENNAAFELVRQGIKETARLKGVSLPLIGITTTEAPEVGVDELELLICDQIQPEILFHASLSQTFGEMEKWPEPQPDHHYELLKTMYILYHLAKSRGARGRVQSRGRREAKKILKGY
jgi:hypothetical protein